MYCKLEKTYELLKEEQKILQQVVILEILDYHHSITYKVSNISKKDVRRYLEVWDGRISCLEYLQGIGAQINVLFNQGDNGYLFFDLAVYSVAGKVVAADQLDTLQQMELYINRLEYYQVKYSPEERKYLLHYAAGCGNLAMAAERADKIMAEQYGINYGGISPAYKRNRRKNHRNVSDYLDGAIQGMDRMYGIIRLSHWGNTRYQVLNPGWDYHIYLYDGVIRDASPRNYYMKSYEDALRTVRSYGDLQANIPMEFHSYSQLVEQINILCRERCIVV